MHRLIALALFAALSVGCSTHQQPQTYDGCEDLAYAADEHMSQPDNYDDPKRYRGELNDWIERLGSSGCAERFPSWLTTSTLWTAGSGRTCRSLRTASQEHATPAEFVNSP